jgi:hypothetical protein
MVDVTIDYPRVQLAIGELLREAISNEDAERLERKLAGAKNADRVRAQAAPTRTLPEGYYDWSMHLFGLEEEMSLGLQLSAAELQARELNGLKVLRRARAQFNAEYPGCPKCGRRNKQFTPVCRACEHRLLEVKGARR